MNTQLDGVEFTPVSPKLAVVRVVNEIIGTLVTAVIAFVLLNLILVEPTGWVAALKFVIPGLIILGGVISIIITPLQVKRMGYAERDEDFLMKQGLFFRRIVAVPYGRLQYVEISEGPILRFMGLTSITVSTAGGGTVGGLTGIPKDEAHRLREVLTARGRARLAGL